MLQHLAIRDVVLLERLDLEFDTGLTVLTGETGAGKSIVIDALALALGERADAGAIRAGATRAEVTAAFALKPSSPAAQWLKAQELFDDGECVLRRTVEVDKPSKAFINGRPVPVQQLRELGDLLVDIHGQHEHQSLLKREVQRDTLDAYAGLGDTAAAVADQHRALGTLIERLETLKRQSADRAARLELLRYQVQELTALNLKADEVPQLEEEHARLAHGAELIEGVQAVTQALYDDEEHALAQGLARALTRLEALAKHDPRLNEFHALLNEAAIQLDEAAARLHQYLDGLELDPQRLEQVERRMASVHELSRKHRMPPEELPALTEKLRTELDDIEHYDTHLGQLESEVQAARAAYLKLAKALSTGRHAAAGKLGKAVTQHMQELGMPGGKFEVQLSALPESELSAHGLERIEFLVSANPGQPPKPLNKVASGGELSRISLALQVVLAGLGRIPTLIFDEVDVGVGGRVAEIVGQKLRALGRSRQALVITHLAQVAAQGDRHLQVSKTANKGTTRVAIQALDAAARVNEIARMMGGVEISKQTLAHAKDMLERASA
jgi:DNA repair protein RecN (Recombination protein N)